MPAMLVISPHLDDAVLSCGRLLAARPGSTVLTVFAGVPRDARRLTEWDRRCGFASAAQAIAERRREDCAALAELEARPRWLDFLDSQYGETPTVDAVCEALRAAIIECGPDVVLYPLGLFHSDHLLVHEASRAALEAFPATPAMAYEDSPYRGMPGLLQQRLGIFLAQGLCATPARLEAQDAFAARKAQALRRYASQLAGLGSGGDADAAQPERFWTLERPTLEDAAHGA
ncbi:MAG TPA: PIG-L family deacetylase [Albitalea sp.]|nr:PIG-L family deacetylase [Albitalea sp.]